MKFNQRGDSRLLVVARCVRAMLFGEETESAPPSAEATCRIDKNEAATPNG